MTSSNCAEMKESKSETCLPDNVGGATRGRVAQDARDTNLPTILIEVNL